MTVAVAFLKKKTINTTLFIPVFVFISSPVFFPKCRKEKIADHVEVLWFSEERTGITLTSYICCKEVYLEVRVCGKELKDMSDLVINSWALLQHPQTPSPCQQDLGNSSALTFVGFRLPESRERLLS